MVGKTWSEPLGWATPIEKSYIIKCRYKYGKDVINFKCISSEILIRTILYRHPSDHGNSIVIADSGPDVARRYIAVSSTRLMKFLADSEQWFVDGTFKTAPQHFYQVCWWFVNMYFCSPVLFNGGADRAVAVLIVWHLTTNNIVF